MHVLIQDVNNRRNYGVREKRYMGNFCTFCRFFYNPNATLKNKVHSIKKKIGNIQGKIMLRKKSIVKPLQFHNHSTTKNLLQTY